MDEEHFEGRLPTRFRCFASGQLHKGSMMTRQLRAEFGDWRSAFATAMGSSFLNFTLTGGASRLVELANALRMILHCGCPLEGVFNDLWELPGKLDALHTTAQHLASTARDNDFAAVKQMRTDAERDWKALSEKERQLAAAVGV